MLMGSMSSLLAAPGAQEGLVLNSPALLSTTRCMCCVLLQVRCGLDPMVPAAPARWWGGWFGERRLIDTKSLGNEQQLRLIGGNHLALVPAAKRQQLMTQRLSPRCQESLVTAGSP
jgi:hypothetical protein